MPARPAAVPVLAALAAAVLLAACASVQPDPGTPGRNANAAAAASGACKAEPVAWAVGKQAEQEVMARVWRESGAGLIRPIGPDTAVTRDYRPDRVNVNIDKNNTITSITCG